MNSFGRLAAYLASQPFVPSAETSYPELKLPFQTFGTNFTYVYNHLESKFHYVSPSIEEILGLNNVTVKKEGLCFLDKIIIKQDYKKVLKLLHQAWDLILSQPKQFRKHYSIEIDYHLRHQSGYLVHVIQHTQIISTDINGNVLYTLSACYDISHWSKQSPVTLSIYYNNALLKRWGIDQNNLQTKLSRREQEIVKEICTGKTSREVAEELSISKHTVDTHRRAIMKKLKLKRVLELVQLAHQHQLI